MSVRRRRGDGKPAGPSGGPTLQAVPGWKSRFTLVRVTGDEHFDLVVSWAVLLVFVCLVYESVDNTAYGKFGNDATVALSPRIGWWLLELPVTITFVYFYFIKGGPQSKNIVPRIAATIMLIHYSYRGWIFPYLVRVHKGSKNFAVFSAVGGWIVTITHGYLNAKWFAVHGKHLTSKWLKDPRFLAGLVLYFSGFGMLVWHDKLVRDLRAEPGPRYKIPHGGLFEYVTCAQYFVELWTWFGFFLLTWGPNGLFIFLVSVVNLVPRAIQTTAWYKQEYGDAYPSNRTHIIPFLF
mmetsp:Transcript_12702/g.20544  ORF Transcript_12702/g.20544 Transcript_12702/m.20544 type:complete len:293 (-) Transcript_12702:954-1832(-)